MAPEITSDLIHFGLEGLSVVITLFVGLQNSRIKNEVLSVKLWIVENFVRKEDFKDSLYRPDTIQRWAKKDAT